MSHVPGLRSPYLKTGRIVYFARMLDKIRLNAASRLPADEYGGNLGKGFDARCCSFLRVTYEELRAETLAGGRSDEQLLAWAEEHGGRRSDEACEVWNDFMMKRGFRDAAAEVLARRIQESHLEEKPILTMFDYLDFDEGRDPTGTRPWEVRG
jgi:hypothetical protein